MNCASDFFYVPNLYTALKIWYMLSKLLTKKFYNYLERIIHEFLNVKKKNKKHCSWDFKNSTLSTYLSKNILHKTRK